jgi:hypothetical protein
MKELQLQGSMATTGSIEITCADMSWPCGVQISSGDPRDSFTRAQHVQEHPAALQLPEVGYD